MAAIDDSMRTMNLALKVYVETDRKCKRMKEEINEFEDQLKQVRSLINEIMTRMEVEAIPPSEAEQMEQLCFEAIQRAGNSSVNIDYLVRYILANGPGIIPINIINERDYVRRKIETLQYSKTCRICVVKKGRGALYAIKPSAES